MNATAWLLLALSVGSPDLVGQKPDRPRVADASQDRYEPLPIPSNADAILKQLFLQADEDLELDKLFKQLRTNPNFDEFDPKLLEQLKSKIRDPFLRPELLDLIRKQTGDGAGFNLQDLQKLAERFKGMEPMNFEVPQWRGGDWMPVKPPAEDRLANWTKDLLKDVDQSRAGDFLRDSPAWRDGIRDLEKLVKGGEGKFDWLRGGVPDKVRLPNNWTPKLGDWAAKLPSMPNLPRIRLNPPNLGGWNLGIGGGPRLGAPSFGSPNVSENLIWLLVPLLVAVLAWLFYRNLGRATGLAATNRGRGPWPVDPNAVSTRTQLIQAFDYLALLLLGDEVRTWNHVAVAKKLGEAATRNPAAGALAQLYELARYTPGDDTLSPDAQAAARRHLMHLAGSAAA